MYGRLSHFSCCIYPIATYAKYYLAFIERGIFYNYFDTYIFFKMQNDYFRLNYILGKLVPE